MAFNPFIGWSKDRLLEALNQAQELYASGQSVTMARSGADMLGGFKSEISPKERIIQLYKALNLLDPATYPIANITPIQQARVVLNGTIPGDSLCQP